MKRFQLGVCEWSVKSKGASLCRLAKESGLDCLQLGIGTEIFSGEGLGANEQVRAYREACGEYGIHIASLSPQFVDEYSFTMPRDNEEVYMLEKLVDHTLSMCGEFECSSFLMPVLCRNDIVDGHSFHRAVSFIRKYAEAANSDHIRVDLELNQDLEETQNLLDAIDCENVKIFFDSQNLFAQRGTSMHRYFSALMERDLVGGIHLKDGSGSNLSGSLLGEGTSGFYKTAEAIKQSSYSGPLIIESVYCKTNLHHKEPEGLLLRKDADTLHRVFD